MGTAPRFALGVPTARRAIRSSHPTLSGEEKLELQGYITRCNGSLTTFNALFADRASWLVGQGDREG